MDDDTARSDDAPAPGQPQREGESRPGPEDDATPAGEGARRRRRGLAADIPARNDAGDDPRTDSPGTTRPSPPRGGNEREVMDDLYREVGQQRRELDESIGLLAEALPQLQELHDTVQALRGQLDARAGGGPAPEADSSDQPELFGAPTASGNANPRPEHRSDRSDRVPGAGEAHARDRRRRVALEHGLHGLGVDQVLCWPTLGVEDAAAAWQSLARFVARVLNLWYPMTRAQLPDCWPAHRPAVVTLSWLHQTYQHVVDNEATDHHQLADWHIRLLPAALAELDAVIDSQQCWPGHHQVPGTPVTTDDEECPEFVPLAERTPVPNAHTRTPTAGYLAAEPTTHRNGHSARFLTPRPRPARRDRATPRENRGGAAAQQLSHISFWLDHYREASTADLAARRELPGLDLRGGESTMFQVPNPPPR